MTTAQQDVQATKLSLLQNVAAMGSQGRQSLAEATGMVENTRMQALGSLLDSQQPQSNLGSGGSLGFDSSGITPLRGTEQLAAMRLRQQQDESRMAQSGGEYQAGIERAIPLEREATQRNVDLIKAQEAEAAADRAASRARSTGSGSASAPKGPSSGDLRAASNFKDQRIMDSVNRAYDAAFKQTRSLSKVERESGQQLTDFQRGLAGLRDDVLQGVSRQELLDQIAGSSLSQARKNAYSHWAHNFSDAYERGSSSVESAYQGGGYG